MRKSIRKTVRITDEEDTIIKEYQKSHPKLSYSEARSRIITEEYPKLRNRLKELESQLSQTPPPSKDETNITQKTETSEPSKPQCVYGTLINRKMIYCDNPNKKNLPKDRLIPIEVCKTCFSRREAIRKQKTKEPQKENEDETEQKNEINIVSRALKAPDIDFILNRVGICLNPILMRQTHPIICAICAKKKELKRKACDEILEELKRHPLAMRNFVS